jgi:hypothetical protein
MTTQSFASSALVGMSISLHLLDKLLKKGVLSADEVCGIAEAALSAMEAHQSGFPEANRGDFEEARKLLETVLRDARGDPG